MKKIVFSALFVSVLLAAGTALLFLGTGEPLARAGEADLQPVVVGGENPAGEIAQEASAASGVSTRGSSGCGSASGRNCCGPASTQSTAERIEGIRSYLTAYYLKEVGGEIEVEVRDLGCHQEAEVRQAGRVIKKLSISGNSISEIS